MVAYFSFVWNDALHSRNGSVYREQNGGFCPENLLQYFREPVFFCFLILIHENHTGFLLLFFIFFFCHRLLLVLMWTRGHRIPLAAWGYSWLSFFLLNESISKFGTYLDSQRDTEMHVNSESASVCYVPIRWISILWCSLAKYMVVLRSLWCIYRSLYCSRCWYCFNTMIQRGRFPVGTRSAQFWDGWFADVRGFVNNRLY